MTLDRALRLGHDATRQDLYEARLVLIDTIIELRKQLARATGQPRWPGDEPKYEKGAGNVENVGRIRE